LRKKEPSNRQCERTRLAIARPSGGLAIERPNANASDAQESANGELAIANGEPAIENDEAAANEHGPASAMAFAIGAWRPASAIELASAIASGLVGGPASANDEWAIATLIEPASVGDEWASAMATCSVHGCGYGYASTGDAAAGYFHATRKNQYHKNYDCAVTSWCCSASTYRPRFLAERKRKEHFE